MKGWIRQLLPKNRFARGVTILAGGTAVGQIIVVAASPLLTRLYSPADFGLLAVYVGLLALFTVIASLRYQLAIPLPECDMEAHSITILSLLIVTGMTALFALAVGVWGDTLIQLLNTPALERYLWLLPIGFLLVGIYQVFNQLAIRLAAFGAIATTKLSQSVVMVVVQLGGYVLGPLALLLGRIFGQSAGIVTLVRATWHGKGRSDEKYSELYELRETASRYRNFPLMSTWTGLSSAAGSNLPPLLIAAFFGPIAAGLFALTHRVLSQPMAVMGKAVGDVFFREAAQAHREGRLHQVVEPVYYNLVVVSLPAALLIFLSAPPVFVVVFGEDWQRSGEIARWITFWLFFEFIATPPTRVYPILNKHGIALRFQLSLLASGVISILIGSVVFDSLIWAVAIMSVLNGFVYISRLVTTFSLVGLSRIAPLEMLMQAIPGAVVCNIPLFVIWAVNGEISLVGLWDIGLFLLSLIFVSLLIFRKIKIMAAYDNLQKY